MRARDFLTEFAPEGFERYSLYTGDGVSSHLVDRFSSLAAAREEVEFIWETDPETRLVVWLIKNLNDEVVWYYDPQEIADAPRYQFRKKSDLDEMAGKVHGGVRKELISKGYRYLGSGIDKQAFLEPGTGQILVIFGYGKWSKGKFSPDQLTFANWAKYCQQHSNNPHLPRFSGWESFDYKGQRYLQIRMEPLKELPQNIKDIVTWLDVYVNEKGKIDSEQVAKKIGSHGVEEFDYDKGDFYQKKFKAKKIIEYFGGAKAAAGLMKTVQIAKRMANKEDVTLDLHGGNYMQRADGTIVVNDPFVATFF